MKTMKAIAYGLLVVIFALEFTACEGPMGPAGPQGEQGAQGDTGNNGVSITWKGELAAAPDNPQLNWAYYNSTDKTSYIWDGSAWQVLAVEGAVGPQGPQGDTGQQGEQGPKGDKGDQPPLVIERVFFTSLTANGDADTTTTILTLTFNMDITGLNSGDITIIDHGNTGVVKGSLTRTGEGTYSLVVFGIYACGEISVVVNKPAYIFNPIYHSVNLYYNGSSILSFNNIETMSAYLSGLPDNSPSNPYQIVLSGLNLETDLIYNTDPLRRLFDALKRYVIIDLRGCMGGFISNTISDALANARPNKDRLVLLLLPDSLTAIGNGAFYNCSSLTSISLPDSLTAIGNRAFYNCSSLTSISLPDSLAAIGDWAFSGCSSLTSISLPDSLAAIGDSAFYLCSNLTSISLPDSLAAIGDYAFYGCSSLTSISLPVSLTTIGDYTFYDCSSLTLINLPASLTTIGESAFSFCQNLASISLSASLTTIGDVAFRGCSSLTSISLPASLTTIGDWAFYGCSNLTSINLPASLTNIGDRAFYLCGSLSFSVYGSGPLTSSGDGFLLILNTTVIAAPGANGNIIVPSGITAIGDFAFSSDILSTTSNLASINLPVSLTTIGHGAFSGCNSLTSISLPVSLAAIGDHAFAYCSSLTSISLPASLAAIGNFAFYGCSSLTSISLPASLAAIGDYAFSDCRSLTSISLPASLTTIGNWAFAYCISLTIVTSNAVIPPIAPTNLLEGTIPSLAIKVPAGSVEAYKAASGWSVYSDRISAIE